MIRTSLNEIPDKRMLVFLWIYDMSLQFRERLFVEDFLWFDNEIKNIYYGKLSIQKRNLPILNQLIFTDIKEKWFKISTEPNYFLKEMIKN